MIEIAGCLTCSDAETVNRKQVLCNVFTESDKDGVEFFALLSVVTIQEQSCDKKKHKFSCGYLIIITGPGGPIKGVVTSLYKVSNLVMLMTV